MSMWLETFLEPRTCGWALLGPVGNAIYIKNYSRKCRLYCLTIIDAHYIAYDKILSTVRNHRTLARCIARCVFLPNRCGAQIEMTRTIIVRDPTMDDVHISLNVKIIPILLSAFALYHCFYFITGPAWIVRFFQAERFSRAYFAVGSITSMVTCTCK